MNVQISVENSTVSIEVYVRVFGPFTIAIAHPLVSVLNHIAKGSIQGDELNPLYIVEDGTEVNEILHETKKEELQAKLLVDVVEGLEVHPPEVCMEGINGSYLMKDKEGKTIAIFKPRDEEGRNSPKRSEDDEILDRGIVDGEGAQREIAAYLLDRNHFSGVPETILATFQSFMVEGVEKGPKTGSLQAFVDNDGSVEDIGPGMFPAQEVHKIGVLDLRIFNNDRHLGNFLYREELEGSVTLVPIDHGLSLSSTLEHGWFDWLMWPQAKQPFSSETKEYIAQLDIEEDARVLRDLAISNECIRTMKITTTLLKKGAAAGLSLYTIGTMASRTDPDEPSELEKMVEQAQSKFPAEQEQDFLETLFGIMDTRIASIKAV